MVPDSFLPYDNSCDMKCVIGIDEVGRGPLAGPVVVCAVAFDSRLRITDYELGRLRDSKKLTAKQREAWFEYLTKHPRVRFATARVYPRQIEKLNISRAANLAARRAYARLIADRQALGAMRTYLDGGLYIKDKAYSIALGAKTMVKGDEKIPAVAAASIIAKVVRDRYMRKLAKRHPRYGFDIHKGYGTSVHLAAIRRFGPSPAHRRTFLA